MSNYWAGYHGTVLLLSDNEFHVFLETYSKMHCKGEGLELMDPATLFDEEPLGEHEFKCSSGHGTFNVTPLAEDETDGRTFVPFKLPNKAWNRGSESRHSRSGDLYAVFSNHSLGGPSCWNNPSYPTYESLVDEFKSKVEAYLPEDFDWDAHIGDLSYAAFA